MTAQYLQDCSNDSALLDFYADRECDLQSAGIKICKAISETETVGWFACGFSEDFLK